MDKISQKIFTAEFNRFVLGDTTAQQNLDADLMPLFSQNFLRVDVPLIQRRIRSLRELPKNPQVDSYYLSTHGVRGVMRYPLMSGVTIYKIPVFSFPMTEWKDHWTATYLVATGDTLILVDTGTHLSESSLREGLEVVNRVYGQPVTLEDVEHIVITHAHFDHFGGLRFAMEATGAKLWVHEWDAHTLSNYPEEVTKGRERIKQFLRQSGMPGSEIETFMEMHVHGKDDFPGYPVTHSFQDGERIIGGMEVIHTPGHCPGLCCFQLDDVLLLGDHVLNHVTPHQFPKIYTSGSGLLNYMNSLIKIASRTEGIRLGLPSHYGDIHDVEARSMEIMNEHNHRIADLVKDLDHPKTLYRITEDYYRFRRGREITGYERLLALEEIGAHMEYMNETLGIVRFADGISPESDPEALVSYENCP